MTKGLGYWGATNEVNQELDYNGNVPKLSKETWELMIAALSKDYPQIESYSDRNKNCVLKWVVNENELFLKARG
ncbi:MAG: hypothetical protein WBA93_06980 [Microcoleaceae cyanobacterium]